MKEIVDWYNAIRAAKFEWRRIAYPHKDEKEVNIYIYIFRECGCRKCSFVHIKFRMYGMGRSRKK